MMSFWILAALLVVIALCYVLPSLLQRTEQAEDESERANVSIYHNQFAELEQDLRDGVLDKEQYEQGRLELQRRLLEDVAPSPGRGRARVESFDPSGRTTAAIVGAAIPLVAVLLYFTITPKPVRRERPLTSAEQEEAAAGAPLGRPGEPTQQEIEQRVAKLAARLKEEPGDINGWVMLAQSYRTFKRYREASEAYGRAAELAGNNAQLWADYAEALALANDSQLQGRPTELINKALQLDPANEKALWLAGSAAFQAEDFAQAVSYWERLAKLLPAGSEEAQAVASGIEEARARISSK